MSLVTPSIFINYRRADSRYAVGRIYQCLADAFGREAVFCDFDSIPKGADFPDSIRAVLADCRVVLTVIGKDWVRILQERNPPDGGAGPDWVREELEIACRRRETGADDRLLDEPDDSTRLPCCGSTLPRNSAHGFPRRGGPGTGVCTNT